MKSVPVLATALVLTIGLATPARADIFVAPFAGIAFGGSADREKLAYGASFGFMGAGIAGVEIDAAITPRFLDRDDGIVTGIDGSNVSTVMANFIIGAPLGHPGLRPYFSAGGGLMRLRATSANNVLRFNENSLGVNIGAGVMGFVEDHFGLRADARFFRGIQDSNAGDDIDLELGGFQFWRATVGAIIRF